MKQVSYYSEIKAPTIDWVFRFFSTAMGCRFVAVEDLHLASVVYSSIDTEVNVEQVYIPIWHEYYDETAKCCVYSNGYWAPIVRQQAEAVIDYVGLTFRLLALTDELTLPRESRDQLNNISSDAIFQRLEFGYRAMVDEAVQKLQQELIECGILREDDLLPRWPDKKRFAVLLTHDTDGPCLLEPKELIKAGLKGFIKRNGLEKQAFLDGCIKILTGSSDPYFNFASWSQFERSLGIKSAFYIYFKSKEVPNHIHNPLYHVGKSQVKWKILRELADQGWEIGLHASIYALEKDKYLQTEKILLEDFLGMAIIGNRCHYWRINWRNPAESFLRLVEAGFTYDCSIAWKDRPGFRSGTAMPYHPYDPQNRRSIDLLEIPTNIMDGHLFEYQTNVDPQVSFFTVLEQVKVYGGVLNLDWHTRTCVDKFSYTGWRTFIAKELVKLIESKEVWFTTPRNLAEHWLQREKQIGA